MTPASTACPTFSLTGVLRSRRLLRLTIATRLEHVLVYSQRSREYGTRSSVRVWRSQEDPMTTGRRPDHRRGTPPARFARGWHCLGLAGAFRDGRPARGAGVRHQAGGVRRLRRELHVLDGVLPAHGRRPDPGHGQGRRRSPARSTTGAGAATAGARGSPTPGGCRRAARTRSWLDPGAERAAVRLARPARATRRRTDVTIPPIEGAGSRGVDRLDLGLDPGRGRELPRGHRQRRGHGALLLHPLRVPDVLQERLRGPHRHAVPADQVAARTSAAAATTAPGDGRTTLRSEASYYGPSYMINYLWHDYHGIDHGERADQLPLPGHARPRSCCSGA